MSDPMMPPTPIDNPVFKPIELFQTKEILDGTEFIAVSETEKINLKDQILKNVVNNNITESKPLPENEFYNLTTAVAAIEENLKKVGYELSFVRKVVNEYYYETYKFKGAIEEFNDLSKWVLEHNYLFDDITTKMPELYFSSDGKSLSESISEGDIAIPVNVGQTHLIVPFEYKAKGYFYIPTNTILRTQTIIKSTSPYSQYLWLQLNGVNQGIFSHDNVGVLYIPSDKLRIKSYFIPSAIFIKPGDNITVTISTSRQTASQSDTYFIKNVEPTLAMMVFMPPTFADKFINYGEGLQVAADEYLLHNSKRPILNNLSDPEFLDLNTHHAWKGSQTKLKFTLINKVMYGSYSIPYNLPNKSCIENKKLVPIDLDFSMADPNEKLMSTFGSTYTLQPGYLIIITYQWVVWDDGTVICMLSKTDDFITQ